MDYSLHFNQEELSDVVLSIAVRERADVPAECSSGKRRRSEEHATSRTFFLHKFTLYTSPYFKSHLQRWQQPPCAAFASAGETADPQASARPELLLHVDHEDELEAFEIMLKCMYKAGLPGDAHRDIRLLLRVRRGASLPYRTGPAGREVANCTGGFVEQHCGSMRCVRGRGLASHYHQLRDCCSMQVYCLADKFEVPAPCMAPIVAALTDFKTEELDVTMLSEVYCLPEGLFLAPPLQKLAGSCQARLVTLFGDVPAVIVSEERKRQFCALPHAAVLAWLKANDLKVRAVGCRP